MSAKAQANDGDPIRILMTADAVGGVWQYTVDLIAGFVDHGAQVLVASMGPRPSSAQRAQLLATPQVTLAESDYALEWMPDPWSDVDAAGRWLLDLAGVFQPGIIHLNGYAHAALPWCAPVVVVAHSCVWSWWKAVHGCAPATEWMEYKLRVTRGLAAGDIVIAPSASFAETVSSEYGVAAEKLRVIHNSSRSRALAAPFKEPFVLAAGRVWDAAKNLPLLEQIAPELECEVRIAGSGRAQNASPQPPRAAYWLGLLPHSELINQMQRAAIFAHPALYEPFGLSILEAARARCCLVLSDIPSLRELWNEAAVFADPLDPDQWVFEINRLSRDVTAREALGAASHAHAAAYSADAFSNAYWTTYRSLIQSKVRAGKGAAA